MGTQAKKWQRAVSDHFDFLVERGFGRVETDDSSFWSVWVQYRSETAAIRVAKSNEDRRCGVQLIRLVDGDVPAYPIWITGDRIDWTLLDNVVEVRRPDLLADVGAQHGLKPAELDEQLRFWAQVLREVAPDFLNGDFAPLDEAGDLIRRRVDQEPQQVRVWIPDNAPEGAEREAEVSARATLPRGVGVSVRRYWRNARKRRHGPNQRSEKR